VEQVSWYTISLNLEFTQYLISSIIVPQHSRNCPCPQTFQEKLSKMQTTAYSCSVFKNSKMGTSETTGISALLISPPFRGSTNG
jgi:hypothetical protein